MRVHARVNKHKITKNKKIPIFSDFKGVYSVKGKREKAVLMLVSGDFSLKEIADKLKISERTLYNWRNEDEFAAEVEKRTRLKISALANRALKKQEELLDSRSAMVSHLAAKDIMDRAGLTAPDKLEISAASDVTIIDDIPRREHKDE